MRPRKISISLTLATLLLLLALPSLEAASGGPLTWVPISTPTPIAHELRVDPYDDTVRYVRSDIGLYVTWDAGGTWQLTIDGLIGALELDPQDPGIVYVSVESQLYRSFDQGRNWELLHVFPWEITKGSVTSPTFIDSVLASDDFGTLVVGLTSLLHSARVYTSYDDGATWQISFESPEGFHIWDLAEVPSNGYWFFCTEDANHTAPPVVMRSRDRGATWQEIVTLRGVPMSGHGLDLEVHPLTERVYFLSEATVLRYSDDYGRTWSNTYQSVGFGVDLLLDPNCPNRLFGAELVRGVSLGGVFISEDRADSFAFEGLSGYTVTSLDLGVDGRRLFASTYGGSLFEAEIDGRVSCE